MAYIDSSIVSAPDSSDGGLYLRLNYNTPTETATTYSVTVTTLQIIATKKNQPTSGMWYGFEWDTYAKGSTQMKLTSATTQTNKPKSSTASRASGKYTTYTWTFNKTYTWDKGHAAQTKSIVGNFVGDSSQGWGWVDGGGAMVSYFTNGLNMKATLTLTVPALSSWTVTLDNDGVTENLTKYYGESLSLPAPTKDGYRFDGWSDGTHTYTTSYTADDGLPVTLTAVWTAVIESAFINELSAYRADANGNPSDDGEHLKARADWSVRGAKATTISINVVVKDEQGQIAWEPASPTTVQKSASDLVVESYTEWFPNSEIIAASSQYQVIATISADDKTDARDATISTAFFTIDVLAGGHGIAFGKPAETDYLFEVDNMDVRLGQDLAVSGNVYASSTTPLVPIGTILDFAAATAPTGYLVCDGSAVSRTDYAALFAVIGTTWGSGDGSTTFNVPDFRGRTAIGAGTGTASDATAHALGSKGGTETHKLTGDQSGNPELVHSVTQPTFRLPAHSHTLPNSTIVYNASSTQRMATSGSGTKISVNTDVDLNTGGVNATTRPMCDAVQSVAVTKHSKAAAAQAHPNLQPYATVTKIIRAI